MNRKLMTVIISGMILVSGITMVSAVTSDEVMPISTPANGPTSLETRFSDIKHHWASDHIILLEEKGVWNDLSHEFNPNKAITGEELTQYLDMIFHFDVNPDLGYPSDQEVSRMEAALAVHKSFEVKKLSVVTTELFPIFEDTMELTSVESGALSFIFNTGIMKGRDSNYFSPDATLTRAELATILVRSINTLKYAEPI